MGRLLPLSAGSPAVVCIRHKHLSVVSDCAEKLSKMSVCQKMSQALVTECLSLFHTLYVSGSSQVPVQGP